MTRETAGSEATGPNIRLGPQHADVDQTAPPSATAKATSSRIFPGSCTVRGLRHGVSATDIAVFRTDLRTISASSTDPACERSVAPLLRASSVMANKVEKP